jgi:phage major head subunit gpT-like protein
MPVNTSTLRNVELEASNAFLKGLQAMTPTAYRLFTQVFKMNTKTVEAPILSMVEPLREWIGPRLLTTLSVRSYAITAKDYERTVRIPRNAIDDATYDLWMPQLETLGRQADALPDQQVFLKLANGKVDLCYDGLAFFSASHPTGQVVAGVAQTFSNLIGSGSPAWYLFDTTKSIMPMVWGDRKAPEYAQFWSPDDDRVFYFNEYVQGVFMRGVADYGFPQFATRIENVLDANNFENALVAMTSIKNDNGQNMGVRPSLAIIPPSLEPAAKRLWGRATLSTGEDNINYQAIKYVVSPYLP